jgi:hypothetical protein
MNRLKINRAEVGGGENLDEANVRSGGSMSTTNEQRVARKCPGFSGTRVSHHDHNIHIEVSTDNGADRHNER